MFGHSYRLCVLTVGAALTAGCAQSPPRIAPSAPAAVMSGASSAAQENQAAPNGLSPHLLDMARNDGYRPVTRDGGTLFCRTQIPIGSNLPIKHCVNSARLRSEVLEEQQERLNLNQQRAEIGQPGGGGGG